MAEFRYILQFLHKTLKTCELDLHQPLKPQSQLQQAANFATSFLIFERNKL